MDSIVIRGAREHNLKNIDVVVPRNKFVVITGVSGSGKSSLAFDTIFAEGQRRYVESLSAYARQFLEQMEKPDVDSIEGLSPAISIEQRTTSRNPRSTVGTVTEIYDYLRLLYASIGVPHCTSCGKEKEKSSSPKTTPVPIAASPSARSRRGSSLSIHPTAPVRAAPASAFSWRSTSERSSPTLRSRSTRGPSRSGRKAPRTGASARC